MKLSRILSGVVVPALLLAQPLRSPFPFLPALQTPLEPVWWEQLQDSSGNGAWLIPRGGELHAPDGTPRRLFGVVLYNTACFPDSATAIAVAQRLQALGFNAVALVGIDYSNWDASSILQSGTSSSALSPAQMQRLDWFISQLARHNIAVFLALHARWTPRTGDGVPRRDSIPTYGRAVLYTDSAFQQRHRAIVRLLLEHVNPYTGRAYRSDPAIAGVWLTWDNSLLNFWVNNRLHHPGGILSHFHSRQLDTLFAAFLRRKYGSDAALRAAWSVPAADTQNFIPNGSFEDEFSLQWTFSSNSAVAQAVFRLTETNVRHGRFAGLVRIARTNGSPSSVILYNGTQVQQDRLYELRFWARASRPQRPLRLQVYNGEFPYQNLGLYRDTVLGTAWQEFRLRFRAPETAPAARLIFYLGQDTGEVVLDDVRLHMLDESPLQPGESLTTVSIARSLYGDLLGATPQRMRDNVEFYTELQQRYYESMSRFLRDSLGYRGIILAGTLLSTFNDLWSMQAMDGIVGSTGWDYRRNRTEPQGSWFIANTPMLGHTAAGNLPGIARASVRDKLSIGLFSMPFPSAHMAEMPLLLSAYGAYQGWDAVFLNYGADSRETYTTPFVGRDKHYELWAHSAVMSLAPSAAIAFRNGLIRLGRDSLPLQQTRSALLRPQWQQGSFWLRFGADNRIMLLRRVFFDSLEASQQSVQPQRQVPELREPDLSRLLSDTEELLWNALDTLFTVTTPRYIAATGRLKGILQVGPLRVERLDSGWVGTVTWLSLDTAPLPQARRSLLTAVSRACNSDAVWEGSTSIWQGWGTAPMVLEALQLRLSWESTADTILVYGLDSLGRLASGPFSVDRLPGGRVSFRLDQTAPLQHTPWFLIEQRWKPTDTTSVAEDGEPPAAWLRVTPHPAGRSGRVEFLLPPTAAAATLLLVDPLGRTQPLWHGRADGALREVALPALAPALYWLELRSGHYCIRHPVLVSP
jgi:hypothetical protein